MTAKIIFSFILTFIVLLMLPGYSSLSQTDTFGHPPSFEPGVRLEDSSGNIGAGPMVMYSAPCVADWNEDGKKDLLIGIFLGGNILLYLNEGTNSAPIFTTSTKIQADGANLAVAFT